MSGLTTCAVDSRYARAANTCPLGRYWLGKVVFHGCSDVNGDLC